MLCHIPQRKDDCNYGSSLEQRNKTTGQCQTFRFYYRRLHLCQNTCIKVFAQSYFLLNLLINKQILIAKQMSRNFFLCEEVAQCCFLLNGSFALPISLEELFYIPKPSVYLGMDFTKAETSAEGTVGVSLRVCDLFAILFTLAAPVGKWFLRWRRAHGGEAKAEPPAERAAAPETNEPEKRTA